MQYSQTIETKARIEFVVVTVLSHWILVRECQINCLIPIPDDQFILILSILDAQSQFLGNTINGTLDLLASAIGRATHGSGNFFPAFS